MANRNTHLPSLSAGLLVAATGVGAGDLVISALSGARYGLLLLWAIAVGALLKFLLNEGLARWELATGTTLLEGWVERLPRPIVLYFGAYLVFWAFLVAGTLITYTGLVANTVFPLPFSEQVGTAVWGGIQSLLATALVIYGGFRRVENVMKVMVALLFVLVIGCAAVLAPPLSELAAGLLLPRLGGDADALIFVFALIGGVGGTLTIMCYAYWLRETRTLAEVSLPAIRFDLGVAYLLTAVFGIAVTIIAAGVGAEEAGGYALVTSLAKQLDTVLGAFGYWAFLLGFWAAVLTSLIGVWSGVPYLFADLWQRYGARYGNVQAVNSDLSSTLPYRWFLLYLAVPPLLLTLYQRPGWIGVAYAISGAAFMPFLAVTLLYLNNRRGWVGNHRNGWLVNVGLAVCLLLYLVLLGVEVMQRF